MHFEFCFQHAAWSSRVQLIVPVLSIKTMILGRIIRTEQICRTTHSAIFLQTWRVNKLITIGARIYVKGGQSLKWIQTGRARKPIIDVSTTGHSIRHFTKVLVLIHPGFPNLLGLATFAAPTCVPFVYDMTRHTQTSPQPPQPDRQTVRQPQQTS